MRICPTAGGRGRGVLVVDEQFFKAGAVTLVSVKSISGRVTDALPPSAMFCFSGAGRLHHFFNSAVSTLQMFFTKAVGEVVDDP